LGRYEVFDFCACRPMHEQVEEGGEGATNVVEGGIEAAEGELPIEDAQVRDVP
jgi:hypothetical protein